VLTCGTHKREISGGDPATTNNRMELQAAIEALRALKVPCEVALYTDSQYLRQGITQWIATWKRRGWLTVQKQPVKNRDLWMALDGQVGRHTVKWHWLKGHAGHSQNERCDALAGAEMDRLAKRFSATELKARLRNFQTRAESHITQVQTSLL